MRVLTSQVPISAAGQTLYDAVDYFERVLFKGRLRTPCRVAQRVPLRGIMSLHNTDGIRDVPQIGGMIRQVLAGGDILRASGLPNARVVVTSENETVLFDGHHTVMAYIAAGCNYLDEVPHLVVHNGNGRVGDREIPALFRTHSKELSPSDWRYYVVNWEAPADRQLRVRIQGSIGELFDSLCPQIFALRDRPAKLGQTWRGRVMGTVNPAVQNRRNSANGEAAFCEMVEGEGPLVAVALHHGHAVRAEVNRLLAMHELDRLREEDPYTGLWADMAPTRIMVHRSRFEVDLNRPREGAVYRRPQDAWGLRVWKEPPSEKLIRDSLTEYDEFYRSVSDLLSRLARRFGRFVIFDLHSYNHRRAGPDAPRANEAEDPEVNVSTGTMDRSRWAPVVDRFITELQACKIPGGSLDVRENVRFCGGHFSRWVHETFPESSCVLSIEFKKFFMDEWTGKPNRAMIQAIGGALRSTVPGVLEELTRLLAKAP